MADLVNLQEYSKAFRESSQSLAFARAHVGLVKDHLSERPRISQVRFNMATAEMHQALDEITSAIQQLQFALSNLVHNNSGGRG